MDTVIEVKDLNFGYENSLVLQGAELKVKKGDFIGILGENGSGKSTLIKIISGMEKATSGDVTILGKSINHFNEWRRIGYVPQKANSFNTDFPATVEEIVGSNMYTGFKFLFKGKKERIEKVAKALELVGMSGYSKRLIGRLSGGQQQRVFIARALVGNPEILLMDEPTVGIDAKTEEAVYCLLARLNQKLGITIVMVTHDISAVTSHANKIAFLSSGKVQMYEPEEKITSEDVSKIYGYDVQLNTHKHNCSSCSRWEEAL